MRKRTLIAWSFVCGFGSLAGNAGPVTSMPSTAAVPSVKGVEASSEKSLRARAGEGELDAMVALSELLENRGDVEEAFWWVEHAANIGYPRAMAEVGRFWVLGVHRAPDHAAGEEWLNQAVAAGEMSAYLWLGVMKEQPRGEANRPEQPDYAAARKFYELAVAGGEVRGTVFLSVQTAYGRGVSANPRRAWSMIRKLIADGEPMALAVAGRWLVDGLGQEPDGGKAVEYLRRASDAGIRSAHRELALLYRQGDYVDVDEPKAVQLLTLAAKKGDLPSMRILGGMEVDPKRQVIWWKVAAEYGDVPSMGRLGDAYFYGNGVDEDEANAVRWYLRAAEGGSVLAARRLGDCYYDGMGVGVNFEEAAKWYAKASSVAEGSRSRPDADAMCSLGWMYQTGKGVSADVDAAKLLYEQAAELGHSCALVRLSYLYSDGLGVERSQRKAFELRLEAAEAGEVEAMYLVAEAYEKGRGVMKDEKKAMRWRNRARASE